MLDGGAGEDRALYAGPVEDYRVVSLSKKRTQVTDLNPVDGLDEGTDSLRTSRRSSMIFLPHLRRSPHPKPYASPLAVPPNSRAGIVRSSTGTAGISPSHAAREWRSRRRSSISSCPPAGAGRNVCQQEACALSCDGYHPRDLGDGGPRAVRRERIFDPVPGVYPVKGYFDGALRAERHMRPENRPLLQALFPSAARQEGAGGSQLRGSSASRPGPCAWARAPGRPDWPAPAGSTAGSTRWRKWRNGSLWTDRSAPWRE
jgi:hypothetical protein